MSDLVTLLYVREKMESAILVMWILFILIDLYHFYF
jgi:hypothetical protein